MLSSTDAFVGETATETEVVGAVRLTAALAFFVVSAALVADTVTLEDEGIVAGAVYTPLDVIVPTVLFPPALPFTAQVTDVLLVPETDAVNC